MRVKAINDLDDLNVLDAICKVDSSPQVIEAAKDRRRVLLLQIISQDYDRICLGRFSDDEDPEVVERASLRIESLDAAFERLVFLRELDAYTEGRISTITDPRYLARLVLDSSLTRVAVSPVG